MKTMPNDENTDLDLDALIASAFAADRPTPPGPAVIAAYAVSHSQEQAAAHWLPPQRARIGWAAAGVVALVLGCAAGAASRFVAVPSDLDAAFGVASAGESSAG